MATKKTNSIWKTAAAAALEAGYRKGNAWEKMLRSHLENNAPSLLAELEAAGETEDYLISRTAEAMETEFDLIQVGVDQQGAHEAAMEILLPATEPETAEEWEIEGANEDMIAAATKALETMDQPSAPNESRPPSPTST